MREALQRRHDVQPQRAAAPVPPGVIRRACKECDEEAGVLRRECKECDEEDATLRREATAGSGASPSPGASHDVSSFPIQDRGAPAVAPGVRGYLAQSRNTGRPLEPGIRRDLEGSYGATLDHVRVNTDEGSARAADALDANAFTWGSSIWFGRGTYNPHSQRGRRLIAHEVAHALQDSGEGGGIQTDLRVGRSDDPAEAAADRAADGFVRGERVPLGAGAGGVVRRQKKNDCTATKVADKAEVDVACGDKRYRVYGTWEKAGWQAATQGSVLPGIDSKDVWLDIRICRGAGEAKLKPSVDLPQVAQDVANNVLAGRAPNAGLTITSGLTIDFKYSGLFQASLGGTIGVDANTGEVGAWTARGSVQSGEVDVGVTVGGAGKDVNSVGGTLTWTPGRKTGSVNCYEPKYKLALTCQDKTPKPPPDKKKDDPDKPDTPKATPLPPVELYTFFDWNEWKVLRAELAPRSAALSDEELAAYAAKGYIAKSIEGQASPEGTQKEKPGKFQGNIALSGKRAEATRDWLAKKAASLVSGSTQLSPKGELFPSEKENDPLTKEVTPKYLGMREGTPADPRAPTDPAAKAALAAARPAAQRKSVFPELRRAVVRLEAPQPAAKPEVLKPLDLKLPPMDLGFVDCPPKVTEAAKPHFKPPK